MGPGVRTHRNVLSSTAPLEGAFCFLTNTRRKASRRSCAGHVADDSGRSRRLLAAATVIQQTTSAPRQLQPAAARPSIARENTGPGRHLGEKKKKKEWRRRRRPDSLLSQSLFFLLIVLCFHRHFFTSTNFSAFSFLAFWCSRRLLAAMKSSSARNQKTASSAPLRDNVSRVFRFPRYLRLFHLTGSSLCDRRNLLSTLSDVKDRYFSFACALKYRTSTAQSYGRRYK